MKPLLVMRKATGRLCQQLRGPGESILYFFFYDSVVIGEQQRLGVDGEASDGEMERIILPPSSLSFLCCVEVEMGDGKDRQILAGKTELACDSKTMTRKGLILEG